ncbi:hypothetical protein [Kallotenue papyrolyticum]|uniref:hypothetical protein n=1 Tax=Kallotenue papyrolyticum TaxID=1325125 RepID=UPI0004925C1B|nr:hypothetical protein [Kallotenue papyrolyticum]
MLWWLFRLLIATMLGLYLATPVFAQEATPEPTLTPEPTATPTPTVAVPTVVSSVTPAPTPTPAPAPTQQPAPTACTGDGETVCGVPVVIVGRAQGAGGYELAILIVLLLGLTPLNVMLLLKLVYADRR